LSYGNSQIIFLLHYLEHFIIDKAVIFSVSHLRLQTHCAWLETFFFNHSFITDITNRGD